METDYSLTLIKKKPDKYFNFYINLIDKEDSSKYFSSTFNIQRLPLFLLFLPLPFRFVLLLFPFLHLLLFHLFLF